MGLIDRRRAFWQAHWPEVGESLANLQAARTPAHIRLIFEELFFLELGLELKRRKMRAQTGIAFEINDRVRDAVKRILPFHPTAAQKRVLKEIADDMAEPAPMRRLLQGDVGSGKTIVALEAAVIAIENGYQVALMAPTEILATQHYFSARRILEPAGYRIVLLTGSQEHGRKKATRRHIAQGKAQLVIGTHALIQETVEFDKLGLVIVDEQHRFGVMQRFRLMKKTGEAEPDVLVMTATPIPRTLALTLYGDLDTSVLDELPPGRTPIKTRRVGDERSQEVWEFVRKQVAGGTAGVHRVSGDRRGRDGRRAEGGHQDVRAASRHRVRGLARRAAARTHERRREGRDHGRIPARRNRRAGIDHGDRGWRGCCQRQHHGDRTRRTFRAVAAPSIARAHWTRRGASRIAC